MASRLNPLTLLAAAAAVLAIMTAASNWQVSLTVAAGAAALAALTGTARRVLLAGGAILVPFWLSLLLMHGLFFPEGRIVLAAFGPARVTAEGLGFAVDMGLRTSAFVLVLMVFAFSIGIPDLVAALTTLRVPPQFGYILASTLLLAPIIAARLQTVRQAQESRGLVIGKDFRSRLHALRLQMFPLVISLVHDSGTRAQALDARGFRRPGPRTSYRTVHDSAGQRVFRWSVLLLAACAVVLRLVTTYSPGTPA